MLDDTGQIVAEAAVHLTTEQLLELSPVIDQWEQQGGIVFASMARPSDAFYITFRQLPPDLGKQVLELVENYYRGEKQNEETF